MNSTLLENNLTTATALHKVCLNILGPEYLNYDPETIAIELKKITENIPRINFDKIQAVSTLITTEHFYTYMEPFTHIVRVFNMMDPSFTMLHPLEPEHIAWGIVEAKMLDPDDSTFAPEIKEHIKCCFKLYGIEKLPPILEEYIGETTGFHDQDYEDDILGYVKSMLKKVQKEIK